MENFMEKEEQIRRWRLILGQESDKRFSDMGGGGLNAEQDLMDQALAAIYNHTDAGVFGGKVRGQLRGSLH